MRAAPDIERYGHRSESFLRQTIDLPRDIIPSSSRTTVNDNVQVWAYTLVFDRKWPPFDKPTHNESQRAVRRRNINSARGSPSLIYSGTGIWRCEFSARASVGRLSGNIRKSDDVHLTKFLLIGYAGWELIFHLQLSFGYVFFHHLDASFYG